MLRSALSSGLSVFAVLSLAAACGSTTAQNGFSDPGGDASANSSNGNGSGDDGSDAGSTLNVTNVGDGGFIGLTSGDAALGAAAGGLDGGCATASFETQRSPIYLDFVLDGSLSMEDLNKWPTAVKALKAIFQSMETSNDDTLGVGLEVFSDTYDSNDTDGEEGSCLDCPLTDNPDDYCTDNCTYPTKKDVALRFVDSTQLGKLNTRLGGEPSGGTPTYKALLGAYTYFSTFTATSPLESSGKQVVVFITDGVPSDDPTLSLNAAKTQAAAGISTFVVGVGPFEESAMDYDPKFLGALAVAGGTSTAGCDPTTTTDVSKACYFQITPSSSTDYTQDFIDAINDIRGAVASCTYKLSITDGGTLDPADTNVTYTSGTGVVSTLYQDATNGWTFDNPTAPTEIELHGTDCAAVKSDPNGKVNIVIGCATETPPTR